MGRHSRNARRFLTVFLLVLIVPAFLGGCTWWDKNVTTKVKNIRYQRLTITSDPPGADVYVNDVHQGLTPMTLNFKIEFSDLTKGLEIVVEKEGYLPVRREVSFRIKNVSFRLVRR
ncbi:MAG: PEGA domain-containing protein [bacterium]|nr:PEGA domain-containing protein [bacterium]